MSSAPRNQSGMSPTLQSNIIYSLKKALYASYIFILDDRYRLIYGNNSVNRWPGSAITGVNNWADLRDSKQFKHY